MSAQSIIKQQIKDKQMSHVYLLFGAEEYLKDEYLARIRKAVCGGDSLGLNSFVYSDNIDTAEIDNAFETYPMFADTKFILIKDSNIFASSKKKKKDDEKDADGGEDDEETVTTEGEFWKKRLSDVPEYVYVVFLERNVDKRSALYKLVNKQHTAAEFERMKPRDLTTWIERKMLKNGRRIAKEDALYITELCSDNLAAIDVECDKLIAYTAEEVHRDDIDRLIPKTLEIRAFDITDGIMEGDADKVLRTLYDLNTQNASPFGTLYLLSQMFDKILMCRIMTDMSFPVSRIAEKIARPEYIAKKYIASAKRFSSDFLEQMVINVADTDLAIKQGRMGDREALEDYVLSALRLFKQ